MSQPSSPTDLTAAARLACAGPDALAQATAAAVAAARTGIEEVRQAGTGTGDPLAVLDRYDEACAALSDVACMASLIAKTSPDAATRAAADAAAQEVEKVATGISLDRGVYDVLAGLDLAGADPVAGHYLARVLRDFRRAGVDRDEPTRARVRQLQDELVTIGLEFGRNIRSDTRSVAVPPAALAGLPADYRRAHEPGPDGLVQITTDYPDLVPFLTYARDGHWREQLWRVNRTRGYPANAAVLDRLLAARYELATLLGYPNWAQYVTEDKMIGSEAAAAGFIAAVSAAAAGRTAADYATLLARKRVDEPDAAEVLPWDAAYLQDRVKAEQLDFDSQSVRPYFEYGRVRTGLMDLLGTLFGVDFHRVDDVPVWHPEVEVYQVRRDGAVIGQIFLDMHPRPDKYNHAAMFAMAGGKAGRRVPQCALVCNLPRPGAEPALLLHSDVTTFFHEFGHLIHHVFAGATRYAGVAGVNTEWDFVEAPSQLLEEWVRDADTLAGFARHHETGEVLPAQTVARLRAAEDVGRGLWVAQQMSYAALSLELHRGDPAGLDPVAVERAALAAHTPFRHVDGTYPHLSFGHLDGYSAMYYTYMWSMVIAKDLFTRFQAEGMRSAGTAAAYRDAVLVPGGSAPAAALVRDFLGRDYTFDAYRRWLDGADGDVR